MSRYAQPIIAPDLREKPRRPVNSNVKWGGDAKLTLVQQQGVPRLFRYLALIRAILRRARDDWEWLDRIPKVRLFREQKRRIRWITRDEAQALLQALPSHLREMAAFSLATGLRQRNVSILRWDQLDMQRKVAWIHPDEAKAGKAISVPLNQGALDVLRQRLGQHPEYVFTFRGRPVAICTTKAWWRALAKVGIEDFRWHDLRHT